MEKIQPKLFTGIVGSRKRNSIEDEKCVEEAFVKEMGTRGLRPEEVAIVSGGCPKGGDRIAEDLVKKYNTCGGTTWIYPAKWADIDSVGPEGEQALVKINRWGKKYNFYAGQWRNSDIVNRSDIIIACVAKTRTGGTEDTVTKALAQGKEVILV